MHLLYIDESGSDEHTNFVLGAVAVFEGEIEQISKQLDDLQTHYFPNDPNLVEFHVRELRARSLQRGSNFTQQEFFKLIDDIASVIVGAHPFGLTLFGTVVHRPSYPDQDNYNLAFEDMCKRFDSFLVAKHKSGHPSKGLLILDRSAQESEIQRISTEFKAFGTRWGKLYNIVDAPLFAESHTSRMIQLADFVSYALFRRYEFGHARDLDKITRRFHQTDGVLHGLKHMISRREECMCAACVSRVE
jgi:Protein of unknown function (DUF3800)